MIDILKFLLDDTETVKKHIMEVLNPESKQEMMQIDSENFDFDFSKITNCVRNPLLLN